MKKLTGFIVALIMLTACETSEPTQPTTPGKYDGLILTRMTGINYQLKHVGNELYRVVIVSSNETKCVDSTQNDNE